MRIAEALVDKRGKVNDVLFSALKNNLDHFTNPMKHITIDGIDGVAKAISALQNNHPEWFPDGLKGVYAVSDSRFFAAYHQSNLYLSEALVHKLSNAINYRPKATVPENYHDQPVRIKRHS